MNHIIALTGPAGSGKTTLADLLVQNHGFVNTSFAQPIKDMIDVILVKRKIPPIQCYKMLYGSLKDVPTPILGGKSPRHAMQTLGTEWRELIDRDLWVNLWTEHVKALPRVVVDDLRFPHEAARVHALGGKVIGITRPGIVADDYHVSEQLFHTIRIDGEILNDTTPAALVENLITALAPYIFAKESRT